MRPSAHGTFSMLESLAYLDTSMTERLEIKCGKSPTGTLLHQTLLPMNGLRTLTLTRCENPHIFVHALHPSMSSSGIVVCPELEEVVIEHRWMFDVKVVEEVAAARASRGAGFKVVRIVSWYEDIRSQLDVLELKNHVSGVDSVLKDFRPHPGEWVQAFLGAASILN